MSIDNGCGGDASTLSFCGFDKGSKNEPFKSPDHARLYHIVSNVD